MASSRKLSRRSIKSDPPQEPTEQELLPKLFEAWDVAQTGFLGQDELFSGIRRFCRDRTIRFTKSQVLEVLEIVDENGDGQLDKEEFGVFISIFAGKVDVPLFDLATFLIDSFSEKPLLVVRAKVKMVSERKKTDEKQYRDEGVGGLLSLWGSSIANLNLRLEDEIPDDDEDDHTVASADQTVASTDQTIASTDQTVTSTMSSASSFLGRYNDSLSYFRFRLHEEQIVHNQRILDQAAQHNQR